MSSNWRAQVNQKLYFAQLLLDDANTRSNAAQTALLEGAVFHLATAYRLYLKEIAQSQNHNTDAVDAGSACRELAGKGFVCQELEELVRLEEGGSWLARLLAACREATGEVAKTASSKSSASMIAVADVTDSLDVEVCRQWLRQFQELIETQRESAQEW